MRVFGLKNTFETFLNQLITFKNIKTMNMSSLSLYGMARMT
jgi:hypothetical protein